MLLSEQSDGDESMELKEKIRHGWDVSAEGFSKIVVAPEFEMPGRGVWTDLILEKAPGEGSLKILDVGTGPGLFATILSLAGHQVTGIDISEPMLDQAKENSAKYGVRPEILLMNSEDIEFADNMFDMIVSRNVVWTMVNPEAAYEKWLKCLKPGGRVVVFDEGHEARPTDQLPEPPRAYDEERGRKYFERFGEMPPVSYSNYEEARGFKKDLKLSYAARPNWDLRQMKSLGYVNLTWDNITERKNYNEKLKFLYGHTFCFRLCGDKMK